MSVIMIGCARCGQEVTVDADSTAAAYCSSACRKRARRSRKRRRVLTKETACHYCFGPATTVDHIVPLSLGGSRYDLRTQVPACAVCNRRKRARWPTCTCPRCWLAVQVFNEQFVAT
jgi:5-methylcytosine-specific restriction endonuclease McrA